MAHDPKTKAAACADLLAGMTIREVSTKHKVGIGTLGEWSTDLKTEQKTEQSRTKPNSGISVSEASRQNQFDTLLRSFLIGTLEMLNTWVEILQDPAFVKDKPSAANELGATVLDRADRLVSLIRPPGPDDGSG